MNDMSAFPTVLPKDWDSVNEGMTLRDYFAGQALIGVMAKSSTPFDVFAARYVYGIADDMIKARGE